MQTQRLIQDADLLKSIALPASASAHVHTAAIDLGALPHKGVRPENIELCLDLPALSDTIIPNTKTCTLTITADTTDAFSAEETLRTLVLTGAGSGVAATRLSVPVPLDGPRYVRGTIAFGAGTTTGAALSATFGIRA